MGEESPCKKIFKGFMKAKPFIAILCLQFGYAGMYIITTVSLRRGMNHYILGVYRHVVATLVVAPFALALERKTRPKMTLPIFLRIAALGFLEPVLDQNMYYVGLKYTSATFASASFNVLPAITFIMAIICRLERVNIKKVRDVAKIAGTGITLAGAMVMTLYKGPVLDIIRSHGSTHHKAAGTESTNQHWIIGTLLLLASCFGWAVFFILQSLTLKKYPAALSLTALICLMGMVEGAVVSLIMERDMSVWKIGFDSRLLAAVYAGMVCSGCAYYIQGMVIKERGPVFATSFSPLCMIITAALGTIILAEQLHLGSVIGAIIIVVGLYTVVWGKSKDNTKDQPSTSLTVTKNGNQLELPVSDTNKSSAILG